MIMTTKTSHSVTCNEDNEFDNTVLVIMTTKTFTVLPVMKTMNLIIQFW